jgi:hypothetical protein
VQFDTDSDKHHDLVANQGGIYGLGEETLHKTAGKDDEIVAKQDFSSKEKKRKRDIDKERKKYQQIKMATQQKERQTWSLKTNTKRRRKRKRYNSEILNNDTKYKPLRATVMGCGGTGKSFIINTIISIVRNMTHLNDFILVGAPTGGAAFYIQGSTLHRLLEIINDTKGSTASR